MHPQRLLQPCGCIRHTDNLLASRPLSSLELVGKLHQAFGNVWFSDAQSVMDDRFKNLRLPLYALTYWAEMNVAVTKQETRLKADLWLQDALADGVDGTEEALSFLGRLEWGSSVVVLNADAKPRLSPSCCRTAGCMDKTSVCSWKN